MDFIARTPDQLGPILKSLRTQRGATQAAAAAKVGLKQATISAIEANAARSSIGTLYKVLSALGLELVIRPRSPAASSKQEW